MADIPTHPESLLSLDQVAVLLNVETRTVRRWRRTNKMPAAISINGQLRWRLATISEWLRRLEIEDAIAKATVEAKGKQK